LTNVTEWAKIGRFLQAKGLKVSTSFTFPHFSSVQTHTCTLVFVFLALLEYFGSLICAQIWIVLPPSFSVAFQSVQKVIFLLPVIILLALYSFTYSLTLLKSAEPP